MFGYITPVSPELKVRDYETYKAVYCGLCHTLGKMYGFFARLTLNYDFTFMALLYMSLAQDDEKFGCKRCISKPASGKIICEQNRFLNYCADSAILMTYYKFIDTIHDSDLLKKIIAYFAFPFLYFLKNKASKRNPELFLLIKDYYQKQTRLEDSDHVTIDAACEPTAELLSVMAARFSEDGQEKRILTRFGYMLGRLIYLFDAIEDLNDDKKSGSFNPFLRSSAFNNADFKCILNQAEGIINNTISELINSYHLLNFIKYKEILDNFIYLGIKKTQKSVFNGEKGKFYGRSLQNIRN